MREQETDREGHQKLMALMAVFTLEPDYPSQELACVVGGFVGGFLVLRTHRTIPTPQYKSELTIVSATPRNTRFVCEHAYEWRGRKGKGKGKRLTNKTASHASYVNG